ncbi:gibberellin receptor gid1b [Nicotiana attenuata]|uniref:Gibberellin receptor gid1b n=1 Tax=Nicotiana attenuata TaxID=49451 RepID=A0A314L147_NICAT|nr:gibberellin receptor gid1b [Nicotiana attenuata]
MRAAEADIKVLGNILLHPMFGGQKRTESEKRLDGKYFVTVQDRDWYWRAYLLEGEDRDHPACNIFGPRGRSVEGLNFTKSLVVEPSALFVLLILEAEDGGVAVSIIAPAGRRRE